MIVTLINIGFLRITFADVLDILMVAVVIYVVFKWIKGSAAINIFLAIISLLLLRVLVNALNMKMMSALLGTHHRCGYDSAGGDFPAGNQAFPLQSGAEGIQGQGHAWEKVPQTR